MSRATQSKSRAEKKGGQSAPTPAIAHEIVPGKYTDVDWNRMLEFDDGEEFIGEIVEEAVHGALGIIFQKYIERQLLPYTISQAKDALLTIIDWRFLTCDDGEADPQSDPTWQEDEEPSSSVPDCWAQGSVPIKYKPLIKETIEEEVLSLKVDAVEEKGEIMAELEEPPQPWVVTDEELLKVEEPSEKFSETEPPPVKTSIPAPPDTKKSKIKFRPYKGSVRKTGYTNMEESLEETERRITRDEMRVNEPEICVPENDKQISKSMPKSVGSILKFQSGRPPGNRDVYYDEQGNVIAMSKINPEKLPTHRIKTKFVIIDPTTEAAQARLDAMRTGRYVASKTKNLAMPTSDKTKLDKTTLLDYRSLNGSDAISSKSRQTTKYLEPVTPLPPPMIESMELAPGVTVREGERVKKGPRQLQRTADQLPSKELLRPVGVEPDFTISVRELLGTKSPIIRVESTPVPPIINKHKIAKGPQIIT